MKIPLNLSHINCKSSCCCCSSGEVHRPNGMIQSLWHPPRIRFGITVAAHIAAALLQVWQVCVSCFGFWGRCAVIAKAWQRLARTGHRLGHGHGIQTAKSSLSLSIPRRRHRFCLCFTGWHRTRPLPVLIASLLHFYEWIFLPTAFSHTDSKKKIPKK